jgi:hypothetical protein
MFLPLSQAVHHLSGKVLQDGIRRSDGMSDHNLASFDIPSVRPAQATRLPPIRRCTLPLFAAKRCTLGQAQVGAGGRRSSASKREQRQEIVNNVSR